MGDDERLHRKDPERTGPIRSISDYVSRATARARDNGASNGATQSDSSAAQNDGVGLAYKVIDKHINDGRRSAEAFNGQHYSTRATADRVQEVIERTIRYSSELLPLWIEALTTAVRVDPVRTPAPPFPMAPPATARNGAAHAANGGGEGSTAVAIEMLSSRPVTVSIDLREHSERMPLATLGLRALDRSKPELSEIEFAPDDASGIRVRISIPPSHPAGTYSGVIVNRETGEGRGTLTVRVSDP